MVPFLRGEGIYYVGVFELFRDDIGKGKEKKYTRKQVEREELGTD